MARIHATIVPVLPDLLQTMMPIASGALARVPVPVFCSIWLTTLFKHHIARCRLKHHAPQAHHSAWPRQTVVRRYCWRSGARPISANLSQMMGL